MKPKPPQPGKSLLDLFPDIAAQANGWDPSQLGAGSTVKMSWKCANGHVWDAVVSARTGQSQGCPYCSGRRAWPGFNDLASQRPDVAARAVDIDPATVTLGSKREGRWRCDLGHEWTSSVHEVVKGQKCAVCLGQQVQDGVNDIRTLFPDIARELVNTDDYMVTAGSRRVLSWRCALGHEWEEMVNKRTQRGYGCPFCSGHRLLTGFNDVATRRPEIVGEADGWDPTQVYFSSDVKYPWRCSAGHKWLATTESRAALGSGCPTCSNLRVEPGINDLATTHPEVAAQADGWDPTTMGAGSSHKPMLWRCDLGHQWSSSIHARTSKPNGCPYCGKKRLLSGFNDIATLRPDLAAEADGWDPRKVLEGTFQRLQWKCSLGHKWEARGSVRRTAGCPVCSGNVVLAGYNDLATTHPELVSAAVGWDPSTISKGHQRKKAWRCELGHVWQAPPNAVTQGVWCPYCAGKAVLVGFNDLATTHPEIAAQADGWDPQTVSKGHAKKKKWRCDDGHTWHAVVANRTNLQQGCPSCARSGFDPNKDGYLYFLEHPAWDMLQVGITNVPKDRLGTHQKLGWTVLDLRGPMDGHLTRDLEGEVLRAVERRGAVFAHKTDIAIFTGWTEAWTKASCPVATMKDLLALVYEDDELNEPRRGRGRRGGGIDGR